MGFELALSHASTIEKTAAWTHFSALVERHDRPGVDELLVSAEAPTSDGFAYGSDAVLAAAALATAEADATRATHIKRIKLHIWSTRGIVELIPGRPGFNHICGELSTFGRPGPP